MDRIKKYNQILYAVVGTVFLIILIVLGIQLFSDAFGSYTYQENTLIVQKELDSLKELNVRNQIVSLEGIHRLDSASMTYVIPVYHKQLDAPQSRDQQVLGLMGSRLFEPYDYYGYGNYNNLILHSFLTNSSQTLLENRMNIDQYNIFRSKSRLILVFTGWDNDSNNDGKLGKEDFKQVFIYNHSTSEVRQVNNSKYRVLQYEYLSAADKLVFKVTEFKEKTDKNDILPEFLVTYSFENNGLIPIVSISTLNRLQQIIDN